MSCKWCHQPIDNVAGFGLVHVRPGLPLASLCGDGRHKATPEVSR